MLMIRKYLGLGIISLCLGVVGIGAISPSRAQGLSVNFLQDSAPASAGTYNSGLPYSWPVDSATGIPKVGATFSGGIGGSLGNNADGQATVTTGNLGTDSYGYLFNGTTYDRARSIATVTANLATPIGIGATGLALYNSGFNVYNKAEFLYLNSDAVNATGQVGIASASLGFLWNGTTYDRAKGDATDGAFVQVHKALPAGTNNIGTVTPKATTFTTAGCAVTASSSQCLASSLVTTHLQIQNTSTGITNNIACNFGGTAILNDKSSFILAPGQSSNWGLATGAVPTGALNCIAVSNPAQLYVEYN